MAAAAALRSPVHPGSVGGDAQGLAGQVRAAMSVALGEMRADRSA